MAASSLYEALGVSKNASDNEIKKQYRKLAKEFHPDKNPEGGDRFKEISHAYKILSDHQKRSTYDKFGLKGMQDGFPCDDFLSQFFAGEFFVGRGANFGGRKRRGKDTIHKLDVSLDELYNGKTVEFQLRKNVLCATCKGKGSKSGQIEKCHTCKGCGLKVSHRQIAPGMMQEIRSRCPDCQGDGGMIREKIRCPSCRGKKVCNETKILEVHVDKGMRNSQQILFRGEGDQQPDVEPGDAVILLKVKSHDKFKPYDNDLYYSHTITLTEALRGGFCFSLRHLDGRDLLIKHPPGVVIKPGDRKIVPREGMPIYKNPFEKGNLYINFKIEFPEDNFTNEANLKLIETLLSPRPSFVMPVGAHVEEIELHDYDPNEHTDSALHAWYWGKVW